MSSSDSPSLSINTKSVICSTLPVEGSPTKYDDEIQFISSISRKSPLGMKSLPTFPQGVQPFHTGQCETSKKRSLEHPDAEPQREAPGQRQSENRPSEAVQDSGADGVEGHFWNPSSTIDPMRLRTQTPDIELADETLVDMTDPQLQQSLIQDPCPAIQDCLPQRSLPIDPTTLALGKHITPQVSINELSEKPFPNEAHAVHMMMLQRGLLPNQQLEGQTSGNISPRSSIPRSQISRPTTPSVTPQLQHQYEGPKQPRIYPTFQSDIVRRPSLYSVPPWPSSPVLVKPTQLNVEAFDPSTSAVTSKPGTQRSFNSRPGGILSPQQQHMLRARIRGPPGMRNSSSQQMIPREPPRTFHSQSGHSPAHFPSQPPQHSRTTRKLSPHLIIDIAETCQTFFPFAQVAERHQVPIKHVFDTFSALIQLPLLRTASEERGRVELVERRMREFQDVRMAIATERRDGLERNAGSVQNSGDGRS